MTKVDTGFQHLTHRYCHSNSPKGLGSEAGCDIRGSRSRALRTTQRARNADPADTLGAPARVFGLASRARPIVPRFSFAFAISLAFQSTPHSQNVGKIDQNTMTERLPRAHDTQIPPNEDGQGISYKA
ncbi:hypothetical protein [Pararobbsia silviterrae]|uniref:hypothetical protein n=1 Tax=Pararobbsia silviterrae TaxID=1792498 RepID=UPI0014073718|nr:hypothetical protein [Pararobbsia silviterrae]